MKVALPTLITSLLLSLGTTYSQADLTTIYDSGSPLYNAGRNNSGSLAADTSYTYKAAGNIFTPTTAGTIDTVDLNAFYQDYTSLPTTTSITVSLYSVTGSGRNLRPGTLIESSALTGLTRTANGSMTSGTYSGDAVYQFSGTLANTFDVSLGTEYFISFSATLTGGRTSKNHAFSIVESTDGTDPAFNTESTSHPRWTSQSSQNSSRTTNLSYALYSSTAVPEPASTACILMLGVAGLLVLRRWRGRTGEAPSLPASL